MDAIQQHYESVPYPHFVHPLADTARLAALSQILGLGGVADPGRARVLDIGCGAGTHLLALAARSPGSHFFGIDFSAPDIAAARAVAAEAGLHNVHFEQADLLAWQPDDTAFDYVIAYGFFSWVPDAVKDRLLHVISQCLAPQGLACVSYLTYPGCKQQDALRDLLRLRTDALPAPADKVVAAHAMLDVLGRAWHSMPQWPHATYLRDVAQTIRHKEPHSLLLDDLGVERDPCYLLQFASWAAEHGLRYLGDSELHTMLPDNLPADTAKELAAMQLDQLQTEQMLDYLSNRSFRCSLLVGPGAAVAQGLHAAALRGLCFTPKLKLAGQPKRGAAEARFQHIDTGAKATLRSVPLVAFMQALAAHSDASTPYAQLLAEARQLAGRAVTPEQQAQLCEDLLSLYGRQQLVLSALPSMPSSLPQLPQLAPLNRSLARHRALLVTPALQALKLDADAQAFCALLDGTHTVVTLGAGTAGAARLHSLARLQRLGCLV